MTRIWAAIVAAVTTAFLSTFAIPAAAWAEQSGVAEVLRRRPRVGFFGFAGVLCCLLVVAGIVAVVFLISRRRR
jgi:hypothetical protein